MDKKNEYRGYTIEIYIDPEPQNPREWDNLGKMACLHLRYNLGDDLGIKSGDYGSWSNMKESLIKEYAPAIILPLYMYDHSGITIKTTPFSCPWDSGQVGYIFAARDDVLKAYKRKHLSKKLREEVKKVLNSEVETYDHYLTGMVYGFSITDSEGDYVDGCSGYYGYDGDTDAMADAKACIDAIVNEDKVDGT